MILKGKQIWEGLKFLKKKILKVQEQDVPMCCKMNYRGRRLKQLSKELMLRFHEKREFTFFGRSGREEYKDFAGICRGKIRKQKAQLELNPATTVKINKKCFYKYISSDNYTQENLPSLLEAAGCNSTKDEEKAEVFSAFFSSVFSSQTSYPQGTQPPEMEDMDQNRIKSP